MQTEPEVTVFVPAYNRERFIGEAIASIRAQTFTDLEILVVDDGSSDRTREVVRGIDDSRIRLVENGRNLGIPKTRNRGLELARGRYIALLDSDDVMHPERLARQVAFLDRHPDFAEIGTWGRFMAEDGRLLRRIRRQPTQSREVRAHLLFRCCISNRSVMGRTGVLRSYGYDEAFPRCQDYDLHVRLARHHELGNLPEVLVYARVHGEQITGQTGDLGEMLKRRIAASQLDDLGVAYREDDLAHHVTLSRTRKAGFTPDPAYLAWAEAWLQGLAQANRASRVYDQAALEHAVSEVWLKICHASVKGLGTRAWAVFLRSPLRRGATASVRRMLLARVLRRGPSGG